MAKITTIIISNFAFVASLFTGCSHIDQRKTCASTNTGDAEALRRIEEADPAHDLQIAIAHKDFRFVGIYGYILEVPGMNINGAAVKQHGIKTIKGTSDAVSSKSDESLQELAQRYAIKYNTALLQYLRKAGG